MNMPIVLVLEHGAATTVAQVSKPAVSPISKSAGRPNADIREIKVHRSECIVSRLTVHTPSRSEKIRENSLRVLECGGKSARHRFRNAVAR